MPVNRVASALLVVAALIAASCSSGDVDGGVAAAGDNAATTAENGAATTDGGTSASTVGGAAEQDGTDPTTTTVEPTTTTAAAPTTVTPTTAAGPLNLYAETRVGNFAPQTEGVPLRAYVPNSDANTLTVIDGVTREIIATYPTGAVPHHVTPSWDLKTLYVLNTSGDTIIPIDPKSGIPGKAIPVIDPYNLYFTPDGSTAIVVAERLQRLDLRDPITWELITSISVPYPGVDHGDFSADGRYFYASAEFSGWVVKVDLETRELVEAVKAGQLPIDVKIAPDGSVLYVADQGRHGVMVLDPLDLSEIKFIPTGRGAHGLYVSRDTTKLYATNRLAGTISVIDFATQSVVATWTIPGGGSPDMGGVSPDGTEFWVSGRYHGEIYVINTTDGSLIERIKTGTGAHGLSLFPQPGRYSLGHTGNYR